MKKLALLGVLLSLCVTMIGCETKKKETAPATPPAAAPADAPPADAAK
jgi:hypothetical protein